MKKKVCLLLCVIIGILIITNGCGNNNSIVGRWVRTDGTYIEIDKEGSFSSDCYEIFRPDRSVDYGSPIKEYEGTYNQGEKEITFIYVQRYELYNDVVLAQGTSSDDMNKDLERTYQYSIDNGTLEISSNERIWTFDKE